MSEDNVTGNSFTGYEYKSISVDCYMESMYADSYQNFGWMLEGASKPQVGVNKIAMKFKRDRKIRNKAELTRLQRQFDACASEITQMEKSKNSHALTIALIVGLIGTSFLSRSHIRLSWRPDCSVHHSGSPWLYWLDSPSLSV